MPTRIPVKLKAQLGESLAAWYRHFGKVAPRRAYHDDDEGGSGNASATPLFESHPLFTEVPIGAPSDLASTIVNDQRTLDEADKRSDELTLDIQNKLQLQLGQKHQKQFTHQIKPQPF